MSISQTDKHVKSIVRNLTKLFMVFFLTTYTAITIHLMIFIILYNFGNSFFYDCPECNTNIGADYMHYGNNRHVFPAVDYYVGVFENEE